MRIVISEDEDSREAVEHLIMSLAVASRSCVSTVTVSDKDYV